MASSKYQKAADDYISRRELEEYYVDDEEAPPVPPKNSSSSHGSNLSSSSRRSIGSNRSSTNSVHSLRSSGSKQPVSPRNSSSSHGSNLSSSSRRSIGSNRSSTNSVQSLRSSGSKQSASSSDEDISFTEYLAKKGITEQTIKLLQEEEISNHNTLKSLTEEDINGLGLKVGQKAIIRSLTVKAKPQAQPARSRVSNTEEAGEVELQCFCLEEEGKGKIVAEITTKHTNAINPIKTRILILVDTSGSMGIKTGRRRKYSKLYRIKGFAKNMIASLDDGDYAGLVTFGEHADIHLPMTEVTKESRDNLKAKLDSLDKSYLSVKTNLSAGLSKALDVFRDASSVKGDLLSYRNAIIVFSDGEVNAGTQDPSKLVHEVREKIRQLSYGLDESLNQWVSISTVVLGKTASEVMYCLSKFCSSDAFYTLDMDVDKANTEVDIFLPVLMRKAAVAWNVSVHIEAINGALIKNDECTQDNKVRTSRQSGRGPRTAKAYFYYDIPAASTKHIGIALDLDDATDDKVLNIKVEYFGFSGTKKTIMAVITKGEIMNQDGGKIGKAIAENYKNDARMISEEMLKKAAKNIKSGNADQSAVDIEEGKSDLQKLLNKYGQMASKEEVAKTEIIDYAKSLMTNMESLLQCVKPTDGDDDDDGEQADSSWLKIKAVSSAISREAPTLSETITNGDILCPLPDVQRVSSAPMRGEMERVYREQGVRESTFFDFDGAIAELKASIKSND